jgi:6-phosphogluconolactonase (cycloisomerase 2 family)
VIVSPDGEHLYAAATIDDAVAVFSRNAATGALTFVEMQQDGIASADGLDGAYAVTVNPDGEHLYVAGENDGAVAVFSRNAATGALTFVEARFDGAGGVDGLNGARSVTVSPDGKHLYVAGAFDNAVAVFSRNAATGRLTFVEALFDGAGGVDGLFNVSSVTVSPDGKHLYAAATIDDAVAVFSRNAATGVLTFVERQKDGTGDVDGLDGARSVTVSPDGQHVYTAASSDNAVAIFSRNAATGVLTFVERQKDGTGDVDGLDGASSVTISPDDDHLYAAGQNDDAVAVFRRLVARRRYVAPTGSDVGNDCRQAANPCLTIAHAAGQANDGDTLDVEAGVYVEPGLVIDKELSVQGEGIVVR